MAWTRSTTDKRAYGQQHVLLRAAWAPLVAAGRVDCGRCGVRIVPGQAWHLGHDDHDRQVYRGPEHAGCNVSAAARAGRARQVTGQADPKPRPRTRW